MEAAAIREAKEETSLDIELIGQFHTYSDPKRDKRQHNISTVFIAKTGGVPKAASDARKIGVFSHQDLPKPLVFDHERILQDYFSFRSRNPEWVPVVDGKPGF